MNRGANGNDWIERLNALGADRQRSFLLVDFETEKVRLWGAEELAASEELKFEFSTGLRPSNYHYPGDLLCGARYTEEASYRRAFEIVQAGLRRGDSFLTNLTFPTEVELSASLSDIYASAAAPYRILLKDEFVCFSPETFVRIDRVGKISSNPMKGTAEDSESGRHHLMTSQKEIAEHATIVDLIRNDLSQVARRVRVSNYRYLERIETPRGGLLQTSSKIEGQLSPDWRSQLGNIIARLLPAGSISGAPKPATLDIIRAAEGRKRGYYCGIGLYFDGEAVDSCVLIRFISQEKGLYYFWAGGGITARSKWAEEYAELKAKVRIPLFRTGNG
ncbi:aminodeoxychorismate synthase component I [Lewinellaceae bacterium SD302]|nr:aminodeoxychorismate synthase component I [Lewinellaceae bacterium SD302]